MYGTATLQLADYQKRKEDLIFFFFFFFPSPAISSRCSAVKFEIHAWILSSFFFPNLFFFCMKPPLNLFSLGAPPPSFPPLEFSGYPPSFPTLPLLIPPKNLCSAGVVRLGGNGFRGYRDRRKWESFTPRPVLD